MVLRGFHRSIRFRITAVAVVAVAAVLVTTAVALVLVQRNQLDANIDQSLEQQLEVLEAQIRAEGIPEQLPGEGDDDRFAEVHVGGTIVVSTTRSADDPYRTATAVIDTSEGTIEVVVGEATDDVDESVRVLRYSLAIAIPIVLLVVGALVWWLVGRTLRPVEAIRAEVDAIGAGDLDRRITEPDTGDEVAALSHTMNQMLKRIDDAVQRQQRFVADASHEMRSPLTRIRTQLEVDASRPETADLVESHHSVLEETIDLQNTVDDMLYLARSDSGTRHGHEQSIDLDDLVGEEAARVSSESSVGLDLSGASAAAVRGDRAALRRAVRNLLDNAARHAETTVSVELWETDGGAVLAVSDDGPGIPPEQRERVFERFTRLDDARSAETGGTGLGLAITREIVEAHGGTVTVEQSEAGGARFVVELPRT